MKTSEKYAQNITLLQSEKKPALVHPPFPNHSKNTLTEFVIDGVPLMFYRKVRLTEAVLLLWYEVQSEKTSYVSN